MEKVPKLLYRLLDVEKKLDLSKIFFAERNHRHLLLGMGRTPNELEHDFSNIKRNQTCSSIDDQTRTPEFWLRTNRLQTSNQKGLH